MLLRETLSREHKAWNRRWRAPYGHAARRVVPKKLRHLPGLAGLVGPFAFQDNNRTRRFEYPWVFEKTAPQKGLRTLEIGGGNAGLQFALDHAGC